MFCKGIQDMKILQAFLKQYFYKQRHAEIGKKIKQKLSNFLKLNFCYLKILLILHTKIIGHILVSVFIRLHD